jgi:chromosome segregation ATPase
MTHASKLKTEIARVLGIVEMFARDLSLRTDSVFDKIREAEADVNNLRTKVAKLEHAKREDDAGVLALVKQVKALQKARGYGTTMEEMVNKISAENLSVEAQRTIKYQAEKIEQLRADWNNEVSVLRNKIAELQAELRAAKIRATPYNPFRPGCE